MTRQTRPLNAFSARFSRFQSSSATAALNALPCFWVITVGRGR